MKKFTPCRNELQNSISVRKTDTYKEVLHIADAQD